MQKLILVEEAKKLLNEGKDWSIWRWLIEKKRVRTAADAATAAHFEVERKVKAEWSDDLKKAYRELEMQAAGGRSGKTKHQYEKAKEDAKDVDPAIKLAVQRVKEADDIYEEARVDAEATFDEAEKRLSGSLAREAAGKAIMAYDLHEKAIRKAEAANRPK
jgi:hypothetical protein